ncbi:MAG: hypothetical protein AAF657_22910 [Acidobacteriota bacterium]
MDLTPLFLALAFVADVLSGMPGTQADLQKKAHHLVIADLAAVNAQVDSEGAGAFLHFELAWGPVVYQAQGSNVADNVIYVAKNTKAPNGFFTEKNYYYVGVAGTNFKSSFDWLIEDGLVSWTVPWQSGQPSAGRIALGTATGLSILQGLSAVPSIPSGSTQPMDLMGYLAQQIGSETGSVHVTGHSLGGALAPVVGLWLDENKPHWGPNADVKVHIFAGPTPGDSTFASYYNGRLGGATTSTWNAYDIVPHAWSHSTAPNISQMPGLYAGFPANGKVVPGQEIKDIAGLLEDISRETDYTAVTNSPAAFAKPSVHIDVTACKSNLEKFLVQAIYQHTIAYMKHFKLPVKNPPLECGEATELVQQVESLAKEARNG